MAGWLFVFMATFVVATDGPRFEVVSIKPGAVPSRDDLRLAGIRGGPGTEDPGRITGRWVAVLNLLTRAYGVQNFQLQGLPDWANNVNSDRYDIVATVPPGATPEQVNVMFQNLLTERFGLVAHHETKIEISYELTVAKGGPKFKQAEDPSAAPSSARGRTFAVSSTPLSVLVSNLENILRRLVVDKTGLAGKYDFSILLPFPGAGADALRAALQQDLGLTLVEQKGPVDQVVIDHLDKSPTPN